MSRPTIPLTESTLRGDSAAPRVVALMALLCLAVTVGAQQPASGDKPALKENEPSSVENLAVAQGKVADKYARLELLLIRMAEIEATSNPQRAALLKRAAQQSTDRLTRQQLNTLVKLLTPPAQLKRAIDEQQQVVTDLKALLELLQSEDRSDRLKNEQSRIRDYIKDVDRLIRLQRAVQGRTEGGEDQAKLAGDQEQVADRTGELAKRIQENEEGQPSENAAQNNSEKSSGKNGKEAGKKSDSSSQNKKTGEAQDGQPGSEKQNSADAKAVGKSDGKKSDEQKGDSAKGSSPPNAQGKSPSGGEPKSDESPSKNSNQDGKQKSSSPGKSPGAPSENGQPAESDESQPPQNSQQSDEQNPARKRLQAAEERMREAQRKLAEAKRKDAAQEQEQAREELERAKAELEQILRQLREEEIERTLALLEGRFRQMLEGQLKIYESTKRLDKIPGEQRTRDVDIQAGKLGLDETKLSLDADRALLLLREEGSSVAFPETVEMIRDDMQTVAERLSSTKIDRVTQGIEEEIIQSLEELIAALQKAQQDLKEKRQQQRPMQPMDPNNRPLVDKLAELKMVRSLQMRVNGRTQRYARLLDDIDDPVGRANDADLRQSLLKLAEMEQRVFEITRNIVLGKNE